VNGMICEWHWGSHTPSSDQWSYSKSHTWNLPKGIPTIAQISLAHYSENDDRARVDLGFTSVNYFDANGVPRFNTFTLPGQDAPDSRQQVARNGMFRIDAYVEIANCDASYLINLFFWHSVSTYEGY